MVYFVRILLPHRGGAAILRPRARRCPMAQAARPMTDTRLPTREELVDRARAMKPALRERLRAARETATLPAATTQDFKDAGFFRILQPKRWRGYEVDPQVIFDVQLTI